MEKDAILDQLRSYLNRTLSLRQLEDWVLPNLQSILDAGDQDSIKLIDEVDVRLMELADGELSELQFFWRVNGLVSASNTYHFEFPIFSIRDSQSGSRAVTSPTEGQIVLSFG